MDKAAKLYTSSKYTEKNPEYHAKDSPFKWRNFQKCLMEACKSKKIDLSRIHMVCEVGCGAGGILACLKNSGILPSLNTVEGWDINPGAIKIANKSHADIDFFCADIFSAGKRYDLMLCADVFEHVENPFEFLRNLRKTSRYFVFNIPLEMNLLTLLRGRKALHTSYKDVGHLHFYSASSAELTLEICGYRILSKRLARNRTGLLSTYPSLKNYILAVPQFLLESFSPRLASALMGNSLVVVAYSP